MCLVVFSLYLFPLSYKDKKWKELSLRNKTRKSIYISCGLGIFFSMLILYAYSNSSQATQIRYDSINPVFWMEVIMLFLFGISWFTKSQIIFADEEPPGTLMIAVD